jgi:predicted kinase
MLLVLSGLPGTGKSELANRLGHRLQIPVLSVDPIESAIVRSGIALSYETGLASYFVVEALVESQLQLGQGAIVDACNYAEPAKEMWRKLAATHGTPLRIIECYCSDEALHRQRLAARRRGLAASIPEPTWREVQQRKQETTPWNEPLLAVDAVAPIEANVKRVLTWITAE